MLRTTRTCQPTNLSANNMLLSRQKIHGFVPGFWKRTLGGFGPRSTATCGKTSAGSGLRIYAFSRTAAAKKWPCRAVCTTPTHVFSESLWFPQIPIILIDWELSLIIRLPFGHLFTALIASRSASFRSRASLQLEILALRQLSQIWGQVQAVFGFFGSSRPSIKIWRYSRSSESITTRDEVCTTFTNPPPRRNPKGRHSVAGLSLPRFSSRCRWSASAHGFISDGLS